MRGMPYEAYQVDSERLATAFVEVADAAVRGSAQALAALVGCCISLLGVPTASAVLKPPTGRVDMAASDNRGLRLEQASLSWGEGPGADCRASAQPIRGVPLAHPYARANWPSYTAMARSLGFACVVAVPLRTADRTVGSLSLLSERAGPPGALQLRLGQHLADATALGVLPRDLP
ncbi:GAF domain-containing protein [Streptomyces kunmingensis]|uniref:GAF domain-containing protein n=1 Tax=Streptomyces kunmingensis TaxID=68225 RepID=A0ABU6CL05_9ACTN|nr:GAF domain-containing protein [Streptomyces kunmingensis]MEB3964580.1 GAF domain-containing protein [Streptomyces kunmingensis]